jgi:acyl transferase domain-containing protein
MGTPDHIALTGDSEEAVSTAPGIAIVGMAGRFPGAASVDEFWRNLKGGVDSVSLFAADELEVAKATAQQPGYIGARSVLKDVDRFDAEFFGIYPREAETMDPQHRIFLECAWEGRSLAGTVSGADRCLRRLQHEHLLHAQPGA